MVVVAEVVGGHGGGGQGQHGVGEEGGATEAHDGGHRKDGEGGGEHLSLPENTKKKRHQANGTSSPSKRIFANDFSSEKTGNGRGQRCL